MKSTRLAAWLWFLAGIAFVVAGILMKGRQTSFFAVAVLDFCVAVVTLRRRNKPAPPVA